jgi:hypothetical protein
VSEPPVGARQAPPSSPSPQVEQPPPPTSSAPPVTAEPVPQSATSTGAGTPEWRARGAKDGTPTRPQKPSQGDRGKPIRVLSSVGPSVEGMRASAAEAASPIAIAALALLALALTSGAFLLVATRHTGAWRV